MFSYTQTSGIFDAKWTAQGKALIAVTVDKKISLFDIELDDSPFVRLTTSLELPISQVYVDKGTSELDFVTCAEDGSIRKIVIDQDCLKIDL